ncbi:hypothetical protein SERLA73DRAFT_185475 [Serpula lacrymans var. lacrymans S7.3]|uniref:Exonuclease domain-containing protein n=2 Tax=Serpula lacrymans var. lacrymans TaxID=341189 RepID=F8Q5W0_SERL3|nr:uncharacterized protein SERLADRAFT_473977 [Serpula lacrymans var. lacrymans S7.9]EGN95998.1 hypothetical protein SERLA73DRAFT_185475 [Serpula lacrymans var. lacrymans S7.3]EGO21521.1 hypothetical protein SERLADRAFT_473977 [Serpula lacrymans var. lacrymans S7.9]
MWSLNVLPFSSFSSMDIHSSFLKAITAPSSQAWLVVSAVCILASGLIWCCKLLLLPTDNHNTQKGALQAPSENHSSQTLDSASDDNCASRNMFYRPLTQSGHSQLPVDPYLNAVQKQVAAIEDTRAKQPYDAFLVLDVEATCLQGAGFEWPNEIIEWPVCLMKWKDKSSKGKASQLVVVDEFRSFVKPTWRPQLSQFCTELTGITQTQVNSAPTFPKVLKSFARFLSQNGLIDPKNGRPLLRFCWCSDGPFDIRDFVVKQCFLSKIPMPVWLRGDVLDVRKVVSAWSASQTMQENYEAKTRSASGSRLRSLNIPLQLRALGLSAFEGRQHSGIDDTRNIARIITELARRSIRLEPNTPINPNRRWQWMGKPGEVLEFCLI